MISTSNPRRPGALASLSLAALAGAALAGCGGNELGHFGGGGAGNITPDVAQATGYVSNNGALNQGTVDEFDIRGERRSTRAISMANEGITLDNSGNLYGANDASGTPFLVAFSSVQDRRAPFSSSTDSQIFLNGLTTPKGVFAVNELGLLLVADNGAGVIHVVSQSARGASGDPADVIATTAALPANPWDMAYDFATDRCAVALTNGSLALFDGFLKTGNPNGRSATTIVTLTSGGAAATNLHGIDFLSSDELAISDVGLASSATDGLLFYLSGVSTLMSGTVEATQTIVDPNRALGNPVDLATITGTDILVVDKNNDRVFVVAGFQTGFRTIYDLGTSDAPESVVVQRGQVQQSFVDGSDLDGSQALSGIYALTSSPAILLAATDLSGTIGAAFSIDTDITGSAVSPTGILVGSSGDALVTMSGGVLTLGMAQRRDADGNALRLVNPNDTDRSYDGALSGAATQSPDAMDVDTYLNAGALFVADTGATTGTPAVRVFGVKASGNASPGFSVTNFGTSITNFAPTAVDYDPTNDRLYVGGNSSNGGVVAVFETFLETRDAGGPSRVITPSDGLAAELTSLSKVRFDAANNQLYVSGTASDGQGGMFGTVVRLADAGAASGLTRVNAQVGLGLTSGLTAANDFVLNGADLYIADTGRIVLIRGFAGTSGDFMGDASATLSVPNLVGLAAQPAALANQRPLQTAGTTPFAFGTAFR